ncbi:VOC family protein [Spirosoma daeguense]
MATTNTYLNFDGNCEEAFTFYKSVFGGEFTYLGRFGDMPESDESKIEDKDKNKVMHVSLPIGQSILMGSDIIEAYGTSFVKGDNFSISVTAESKEEADKIFTGLAENGQITMPMNDTFWGDYFGMLVDKFGIQWMVSFNENQQ